MKKLNGKRSRGKGSVLGGGRFCLLCNESFRPKGEEVFCEKCAEKNGIDVTKKIKGYPCNRRPICRKCAHRVLLDHNYVCACMNHTGKHRDFGVTEHSCKTFERKGLHSYEEDE